MKKAMKVILSVLLLIVLMIGATVNTYAFTVERTDTIDNDDAQGYDNSRSGFDTLLKASTLYYQDARTQVCNSDWNYYRYHLSKGYSRYTPIYGKVSAYLYNVKFTDPEAYYTISSVTSVCDPPAGYINQDLAAAGWNEIGTAENNIQHATKKYVTLYATVQASQNHSTKTCGADAIKVELGYN